MMYVAGEQEQQYIYAAQAGEFIKIGSSRRPWVRTQEITSKGTAKVPYSAIGITPHLIKVVEGTREEERILHACLGRYRISGEWYGVSVVSHPQYVEIFSRTEVPAIAYQKLSVLINERVMHEARCACISEGVPFTEWIESAFSAYVEICKTAK